MKLHFHETDVPFFRLMFYIKTEKDVETKKYIPVLSFSFDSDSASDSDSIIKGSIPSVSIFI